MIHFFAELILNGTPTPIAGDTLKIKGDTYAVLEVRPPRYGRVMVRLQGEPAFDICAVDA